MFVGKYKDFPKIDMTPSGAKGAVKQVVVGPEQGWEDYVLRVITLDVDGYLLPIRMIGPISTM